MGKCFEVNLGAHSLSQGSTTTTAAAAAAMSSSTVQDWSSLALKPDHEKRPFWVCPNGKVILEAFSPLYSQARDFLVAIAEPVARPRFVHEYRIDKHALFAAASMGLTADIVIDALRKLSKVEVDASVEDMIREATAGYGKVKLVLQRKKYFVESSYPQVLRLLINHPAIQAARVKTEESDAGKKVTKEGFIMSDVLQEEEASLGLAGLLGKSKSESKDQGPSKARPQYVADGLVSEREIGEVASDEEDEAFDVLKSKDQAQEYVEKVHDFAGPPAAHAEAFEVDGTKVLRGSCWHCPSLPH